MAICAMVPMQDWGTARQMTTAPQQAEQVLLELSGITKRYPSVVANDDVSIRFRKGHIHAILGENGAGKSTLMKIIFGVTQPDAGKMTWKGRAIAPRGPAQARALGIGMVFQHFSLFETMTVAENMTFALPLPLRELARRIREVGASLDLAVDPDQPVHGLSVGERQRVEIIRCLLQDPDLIIMDEPTAVLPPSGIPKLFETLRRLADSGRGIIFISHKLQEIRALCHTATIMRAGRVVASVDPTVTPEHELARLMVGSDIPAPRPRDHAIGTEAALDIENLDLTPGDPFATALDGVSLRVFPGEIVGIAGVSGNGQTELVKAISGEILLAPTDRNRIRLSGTAVGAATPGARRGLGLAFVPEDRLGRGAVPGLTLADNALLTAPSREMAPRGLIDFVAVKARAAAVIDQFDVRCSGPMALAGSLSGGNLQKFIVGRETALAPRLIVVAQPTWGVDVGATAAIRQKLIDLAASGAAVLVVSDDLDELLEIAGRIHVMFRGQLSGAFPAPFDRNAIGLAMAGTAPAPRHGGATRHA
ncbi:MAG: ABC transporter ATP-binding protein [Alphaproteobacteria bacterium]|nr:ABC transporter ATP-binding protein [Alphaproteobacteria bacterium]